MLNDVGFCGTRRLVQEVQHVRSVTPRPRLPVRGGAETLHQQQSSHHRLDTDNTDRRHAQISQLWIVSGLFPRLGGECVCMAKGPRGYTYSRFVFIIRHLLFTLYCIPSVHYAHLAVLLPRVRPECCPRVWQLLAVWPASLSPAQPVPSSRMRVPGCRFSPPPHRDCV